MNGITGVRAEQDQDGEKRQAREFPCVAMLLEERTARRLAVFCKRAIIERVMPFAADGVEAEKMLRALEELGSLLEEQGFSPR
jgi:hypothetical protein